MNLTNRHSIYNDTQQRILDATINCVKLWGLEKTSLNDIAKQAGVTRPTVYSYYPSRDEVIRAALLQSGYAFGERVIDHIRGFASARDRLLEAVLFAIEQLPLEPYLTLITRSDIPSQFYEDALIDNEGLHICLAIFDAVFEDSPRSDQDTLDIMELSIRLTLSLLVLRGPTTRSTAELRGFLERRLLPAAGL